MNGSLFRGRITRGMISFRRKRLTLVVRGFGEFRGDVSCGDSCAWRLRAVLCRVRVTVMLRSFGGAMFFDSLDESQFQFLCAFTSLLLRLSGVLGI